jgi:hypothetical protein
MPKQQTQPPKDPYVEAQIERQLKPLVGKVTPDMLAAMRERLEEMLTTHPTAVGLLDQLRKHPVPDASGERPTAGHEDDDEAEKGA